MKILLCEPDTIGGMGGGQTVVASLVRSRPDWTFVNPSRSSSPPPSAPNVTLVPLDARIDTGAAAPAAECAGRWHRYDYQDAISALNLAWTFRGQAFDVVEVPDYVSYGRFLPSAFAQQDIRVGRFAQSLHGRLSVTYEYEWFKVGRSSNEYDAARRRAEDLSLNVADVRYGLSPFYKRELQQRTTLPIELVDPLLCVRVPDPDTLPSFAPGTEPRLVFIGRLERLKAADRFVDLLWHLGDRAPATRLLIGSEVQLGGVSGRGRVEAHQRHRNVGDIQYITSLSPMELCEQVYRQPSIVVLPTRHDTFNLTALEAMLHGCPIVLGTQCGAFEYLQQVFPGAALAAFDEQDVPASAEALARQIACFDAARAATLTAVQRAASTPDRESIARVFEARAACDPDARAVAARDLDDIQRILSDLVSGVGISAVRTWPTTRLPSTPAAPDDVVEEELRAVRELTTRRAPFRQFGRRPATARPEDLSAFALLDDLAGVRELMHLARLPRGRASLDFLQKVTQVPSSQEWVAMPDGERRERAALVRRLLKQSPAWLRSRLTLALADGEAASGSELLAAAYRLRVLRWLGDDRFRLLPSITTAAEDAGLAEGARAARLIRDGLETEADAGAFGYLQSRFEELRRVQVPDDYEAVEQRRSRDSYGVSIIVSMYEVGEPVLDRFIRMLRSLAMVARRDAEVIFIDSGSPSPQWPVLSARLQQHPFDYLFVRTTNRETIQAAWNRGIRLSRGGYLAFLGTDEGLHPAALDVLADALDRQPSVDWVMGDSVVTKVDRLGVHQDDVMAYARTGNWSEASRLFDCTYLSYVGGLMRRNIYDRFGMYDASFTGAGDTEFKCRIHPFLETAHIPKTLGVFFDYPADRATASYRVEFEDARAWYLFRTPGGVRYLFQRADADGIEAAFWGSLANRRSFTAGPESDLQLAVRLLGFLRARHPQSAALAHEPQVHELLRTMRELGWQADWSTEGLRRGAARLRRAEAIWADLARCCPERRFPATVLSDAQFFAHAWVWE